jgi:hypothetical protein
MFGLLVGCGAAVAGEVPVTPALVEHARATWPGATLEGLEHGRLTYQERCVTCHNLPDPNVQTLAEWPTTLDDMAKRAGLTQPERDDVQHYLLAAHR